MTEQQLLNRLLQSFSYSGDAIKHTSYADDAITTGFGFLVEKNINIPASSTRYMLLDYTGYSPTEEWQTGRVFIFPPTISVSKGALIVNVYRGTDYVGGDTFSCINPNTIASKSESGTVWTLDPTGSDRGILSLQYLIGVSGTNQSSGGGNAEGLSFFIRPNTGKTLVEMVSDETDPVTLNYGQLLFEI